jgi:hypothetical protein
MICCFPIPDAVMVWRCKPTGVNGQPVAIDTTVKMVFAP